LSYNAHIVEIYFQDIMMWAPGNFSKVEKNQNPYNTTTQDLGSDDSNLYIAMVSGTLPKNCYSLVLPSNNAQRP